MSVLTGCIGRIGCVDRVCWQDGLGRGVDRMVRWNDALTGCVEGITPSIVHRNRCPSVYRYTTSSLSR